MGIEIVPCTHGRGDGLPERIVRVSVEARAVDGFAVLSGRDLCKGRFGVTDYAGWNYKPLQGVTCSWEHRPSEYPGLDCPNSLCNLCRISCVKSMAAFGPVTFVNSCRAYGVRSKKIKQRPRRGEMQNTGQPRALTPFCGLGRCLRRNWQTLKKGRSRKFLRCDVVARCAACDRGVRRAPPRKVRLPTDSAEELLL